MHEKGILDGTTVVKNKKPRSRTKTILYALGGIAVFGVLVAWIVLTFFANSVIHYVVEPKLKQLVVDRLGNRYSLEMNSIALTKNRDSLILTGVRIVDNGKTLEGSYDSLGQNFGVSTPLDRLTTDTVMIAKLDYWKLIFQKGLFAGTITIRSPKIYLRPGTLPKFAENTDLLPSFLPAVSSKIIKVENAEVYLSESGPDSNIINYQHVKDALGQNRGGVLVKKASLEFRDFYLDEKVYKQAALTFFCKSATFHAEDISHVDSAGVSDIAVASVDGDLIDSSMSVHSVVTTKPIDEVRRVEVKQVVFSGLDWYQALAGKGLHGRTVTITNPQIYLQDVADIRPHPSVHLNSSDLIPLPSLLPDVTLDNIDIINAEVYALLPETKNVSSLKRIKMNLNGFRLDHSTPFVNVSTFFSKSANFSTEGENTISTSLGKLRIGKVRGTEKTIGVSNISLDPNFTLLKQVKLKSVDINGVDIWKLLMRDGFFCGSVNVKSPTIYLGNKLTPGIANLDSLLKLDPLALIREVKEYPLPGLLPVANVGSITVSGGSLHNIHIFDDAKQPSVTGDSVGGLKLSLKNFKLNPNTWVRNRGMLFSDGATFAVGALSQHTPGAMCSYYEGGIKGDLRKRTLTVDSVAMHPLISEDSFGYAFKYRTERIELILPKIEIGGVNYQQLFLGNGIFADSISLKNWSVNVYGDRRRPEEPRSGSDKYPHELFQEIITPVSIKRVISTEGRITFRESWYYKAPPGMVTLDHVNLKIGAISNMPGTSPLSATPIEGEMKIMNAGHITFTSDYQLMNPNLRLNINGTVGSLDASILNEFLAQSEPFILHGSIYSATFDLHLKDSMITGVLIPQYDSLEVTFYKWDKFPPGLFSFFANALFMRSHNTPQKDHPLYQAEISAALDPNVSAFWSLWHPIRSAIGEVVRIPEWVW